MTKLVTKNIAIFDLDGTLLKVDTFPYFLIFYIIRTPVIWWRLPEFVFVIFISRVMRLVNNSELKGRVLKILFLGQKKSRTDRLSNIFFDKILSEKWDPRVLAVLQRHKMSGDFTILATASPSIYTDMLKSRLGFDHIENTEMALSKSGKWTGEIIGKNCYGKVKYQKLNQVLMQFRLSWQDCTFYSDHHSDLPVFECVGEGYAVRPTKKLKSHMGEKNIKLF